MDSQIVAVFCLCDDILKGLQHYQDPQCQMSVSEVMTMALVAALFFGGNFEHAREFLSEQVYIPHMLGKSRFPGLSGQDRQSSLASDCTPVSDFIAFAR